MLRKDLTQLVRFSPDGPNNQTLFEGEHLWSQVVCLDRAQRVGPITDMDSDGLFLVLAGEVAVQVNRDRKRVGQWACVLVPAGDEISLANASQEPAVILVVAAPPPTARPVVET